MKPWREVIVPHADIRKGKFDESVFAADLSDVLADRGPLEYRDAETFFRKTYPTQGLVNLMAAVLSRLSGAGVGEPVIQIQTPFGGGKTHSLIGLYHLFKHGQDRQPAADSDLLSKVMRQAKAEAIPKANVVTFVGTAADAEKGKTPWGELGEQLGKYPEIKQHDKKRRAPGKEVLHGLLGETPTLILMDEIVEYAVKAKDFADQLMAFFQELTETVKVLPRCALVATLPSSAPYGEEGERMLQQLQRLFGRVEAIYTPVEGDEVYEVIRKRLIEEPPDPAEARRTAEGYWHIYQSLGDDAPREVREPAYRERLRRAYPFHPELIDLLYERWSTFATFQRTRGVLRLLAEVVADLYKREHPAPLIQPSHLNLAKPAIRREFLKHIGNEYEGVIASDVADTNAKAQRIDKEMGSEYARFGIASGLATSIFFGSFSGAERKGVGVQRLRLAVLREGIPSAMVGDALTRLESDLWYLHQDAGLYWFSSQPNLNRIIVEREEAVKDEQILEEIRRRAEALAGDEFTVTIWPSQSQDVPDTRNHKVAVLSGDHAKYPGREVAFIEELLGKSGQTFRTYRNTLVILVPDAGEWAGLRQQTKRYLALRAIHDDKTLLRQLSDDNKRQLESKLKDSEGGIGFRILATYRHLTKAGEAGVEWFDLGIPTVGAKASLSRRAREYLASQDLLLDRIAPKRLLDKTLRPEDGEKPVGEIVDAFLRYPNLPMLESEDVARRAIAQGVQEGVFGLRTGERVYFKEPISPSAVEYGAVLVREAPLPSLARPTISPEEILAAIGDSFSRSVKEACQRIQETRARDFPSEAVFNQAFHAAVLDGKERGLFELILPAVAEDMTVELLVAAGHIKRQPDQGRERRVVKSYWLRAKVPWDKLSDVARGVVLPIQQESAEISVCIEIEASGEIKPDTLEQKVRETLRQIGGEITGENAG